MGKKLVICIGNDLVADDGVGHRIYHQLQEQALSEDVRVSFLGLGGMALIDELRGEDILVVVDAVQFGSSPGTVHVLDWDHIPASEERPVSGHGIGIREALQVCKKLYPEKAALQTYLVGIEGACFDKVGAGLTPAVEESVKGAVDTIRTLVS